MNRKHSEVQIKMMSRPMAEDLERFVNRRLVLKTAIEPGPEGEDAFVLRVFNPTDSDISQLKKHKKYREGAIRFFSALDHGADRAILALDHFSRGYVVPGIRTGVKVGGGLVGAVAKTAIGAIAGAGNASAEAARKTRQDLSEDPEVQGFAQKFRRKKSPNLGDDGDDIVIK